MVIEAGRDERQSESPLTLGEATTSVEAALEAENRRLGARVAELEELLDRTEGLCEVLDGGLDGGFDGEFVRSLRTRASWLLGLLVCQSCSSFILADNELLLEAHPNVIFFLTMMVGAGGNAGNQAAVRIIRGLASGEVNPVSTPSFIAWELRMASAISLLVVAAGFVRVAVFHASLADALAISASLFMIVSSSIVLGTLLPLGLNALKIDAAHASTSIQVVMDVLGVLITCVVSTAVFAWAYGNPALAQPVEALLGLA